MKWINLSLLIIWLFVMAFGIYWSWGSFNDATTLVGGGYLYDDSGEVIGMWDDWDKANYPFWMFPIWLIVSLVTDMPLWWVILYWGIGIWLIIYYVFPRIMTKEE